MAMEGVTRKKRIRAGHKASATRMLTQIDNLLAEESPDLSKLSQLRLSLQEKLDTLKLLDGEMLDLVEEAELTSEIEQADAFKEGVYTAMIKIDKCVGTAGGPAPERTAETRTGAALRGCDRVKLPKLVLRPFSGDITTWTTFWESYESAVHNNRDLTDIDKFNYLNSLLTGTAREAVSGLSLTSANYQEAIAILKKRFGNVQQIKAKHVDILMNIEPVTSSRDLKALCKLHDLVESHVRSLRALGVDSATYGSLLSSVLLNKLPPDLQLIVSRKIPEKDWNLDPLLKVIEEEVEARERVQSKPSHSQHRKIPEQHLPTATTLVSTAIPSATVCCFCQQLHPPSKCTAVTQPEARKQILKRSGRCFWCLKRGHLSRDCRFTIKCSTCNGRHHSSICTRRQSQQWSQSQVSATNPAAINTVQTSDVGSNKTTLNPDATTFANTPTTTALHIEANKSVFLQTAQTNIYNPLHPQITMRVRVVLDNGSQRSYITCRVKDALSLKPQNIQCLSIATFGAEKKGTKLCETVNVVMKTRCELDQEIMAFVVPHICEPITPQPITVCVQECEHLSQLELADSCSNLPLVVDLLIGSDYYWEFVTGEIQRGETGPVAINTKLGWVLSGPGPPPWPSYMQ